MNAIRTVSETDDTRTIEGLISFSGQDRGRDSYGTRFSARTDWGLGLHPTGLPVLYEHGFDPDFGLAPLGFTSPTASFRTDSDGVWVQMQLDKRHQYYESRIKPLLEAGGLGISQGSAEHSVRFAKDGECLAWPLHEVSLTPTNSNWFNALAARSGELIRIVQGPKALRGWLPEGTAQGDLDDGDFAWLAKDKTLPDSDRRKLPYKIHGKVNEAGWKAAWSRAHQDATQFAGGPSQADVIKKLLADAPPGVETKYDDGTTPIPGGRSAYRSAADDVSCATGILSQIAYLMGREATEADQLADLQAAATAIGQFIPKEVAEIGTPDDIPDLVEIISDYIPSAFYSAMRAGARNSQADQALIDTIHDSSAKLGATAHVGDTDDQPNDDSPPSEDEDDDSDAARSGERLPAFRVVERPDPSALRPEAVAIAEQVGRDAAKRLVG